MTKRLLSVGLTAGLALAFGVATAQACGAHKTMQSTASNDSNQTPITTAQIPTTVPTTGSASAPATQTE